MVKNTRKLHHKNKQHNGKKPKLLLGLLYADWCGHCQHLKPEWAKMKDIINKDPKMRDQCEILEIESADPKLKEKLNNVNNKIDGEKLDVSGYPTIFLRNKGKLKKYEGGRTAEELLSWIKSENNNHINDIIVPKPKPFSFFGGKKRRTKKYKKCNTWKL